jgi:hypothetical protein
MKKIQKFLACVIAIAMIFSMGAVNAFASDVSGDGGTVHANLKSIVVELPTSTAWSFTLDPLGLASATYVGDKVDVDSLVPQEDIIVGSYAPTVISKSSHPVAVTVAVRVTGTGITPVADEIALKANTNNNILLSVVASTALVDDDNAASTFAGTINAIDSLALTDKSAKFALGTSAFEVERTGTDPNFSYTMSLKADEKGKGTKIQLAGKINLTADWSTFAGTTPANTVGVAAKFSFEEATTDEAATANHVTGAYGLIDSTKVAPPGPTGTVALSNNNLTVVITAANFSFPETIPSGGGIGVTGINPSVTIATTFMNDNWNLTRTSANSGTNNRLEFTLPAGWTLTGAQQGWTKITLNFTGFEVVIEKASTAADTATVTIIEKP